MDKIPLNMDIIDLHHEGIAIKIQALREIELLRLRIYPMGLDFIPVCETASFILKWEHHKYELQNIYLHKGEEIVLPFRLNLPRNIKFPLTIRATKGVEGAVYVKIKDIALGKIRFFRKKFRMNWILQVTLHD